MKSNTKSTRGASARISQGERENSLKKGDVNKTEEVKKTVNTKKS